MRSLGYINKSSRLTDRVSQTLAGKLQGPLGAKARVVFSANFRVGSHTHTLTARYVTQ